ncbi:DMT family transporter [Glycomyces algeriensis]|uniref:Membrane protein n=1 Tax=Glycomyces algeriensis TaxID=256037 RepID=A0A9W6GD89_9ACTN|nr:DMT family transporter [Glycomyces algeriensis]MDA1367795.1 DMT family transporter [Glycomyces algeriensis]MDR7351941.1 drug/metabolite transporter (DMT)-like permease [Glycomyces algeriensis]GLI44672.1 membrane protein [Glycomyces algeriensis]
MRPLDRIWAAAFVIAWSSGFIGNELGTRHGSALDLLTWRFLLLAAPSLLWLAVRRVRDRRALGTHLAIGVLAQAGFLSGIAFAADLGVAPGVISLIAGLQPIVMAAAAALLLGESIRRLQILGLGVGLAGVALVVSADGFDGAAPLWAFTLPLMAVLSLVAATVLERRAGPQGLGPVDALAVQFLAAAAVFTLASAIGGDLAPSAAPGFWAGVAWTAVLAGLGGYGLYWVVVRRSGATTASSLLYLTPPTTMLWAWLMFGDELAPVSWIGLAVTAVGVALALNRERPAGKPRAPADRSAVR